MRCATVNSAWELVCDFNVVCSSALTVCTYHSPAWPLEIIVFQFFWQAQDSKPERAFVNSTLTDYEVTVHTSDIQDAGTDADVSLIMYSALGKQSPCIAAGWLIRMPPLTWRARIH